MFNHFSLTDWHYYDAMIKKDEEEYRSALYDAAEYIGSFTNPKAAEAARKARADQNTTNNRENDDSQRLKTTESEDQFLANAQKMFDAIGAKEAIDG